ncbi:MAG: STAS domain-containing protein [Rhodocyclaceae bacterium]
MGLSSFFGKKQDKSRKKDDEHRVAAPKIVTPQKTMAPPPPPPPVEPAEPKAEVVTADAGLDTPPPKEELPELDFTSSGVPGYAAAVDDESMQIHEGSSRVHPIVEEVAILYANGSAEAALHTAEAAIQRPDLGSATEQMWALLFELYQALGRHEDFEQRAYEFLLRFEKSPPSWSAEESGETAAAPGNMPVCNLSGALSAASAKQFEQMERIVAKNTHVRLDVAKVSSADAEGCTQLIKLLESARKQKRSILVQNGESLARLLLDKVSIGQRENQPLWLLLLELQQQHGDQEVFEEWALNYAITFEVSPPSWDPQAVATPEPTPKSRPRPAVNDKAGVFTFDGEMTGASASEFAQLAEYAAQRDPVVIDLTHLRRIDFVSTGMLLNTLSALTVRGKTLRLVNASALVAALFSAMGINQLAEIVRRRS